MTLLISSREMASLMMLFFAADSGKMKELTFPSLLLATSCLSLFGTGQHLSHCYSGWDASLSQVSPQVFVRLPHSCNSSLVPIYNPGWREALYCESKVSCPRTQHIQVQRTNHEATALLTCYWTVFTHQPDYFFISELTDNWINSTLMCYLPPFTGESFWWWNINSLHKLITKIKLI